MKIFFLPPLLNVLDKIFINWAKTIVVLDKAMAQHVSNITDRNNNVHVIPPWATYLEPAKTMRVPKFSEEKISLLYAGNYGFAHSLVPLKECLAKVDPLKRSKVHMCFVGMNEQAQQKIRELFANLNLQLTFAPRFANLVDLCSFMENFDLGIVSLRMDYAGFACPSKALTYLSQGLPVFYVGPKYTLSYELVEEGYGLPLSKEFFEAPLEFVRRSKLQSMLGKVFPNPAEQAKKDFLKLVEKYV